jgi:hypothetical protein
VFLFMVQIVLVRIHYWISLCLDGLVLIISRKHLNLVSPPPPPRLRWVGVEVDGVGKPHKPVSADLGAASIANLDKLRQASGPEPTAKIRLDMQKVMQTYPATHGTFTANVVMSLFSVPKSHCKKESRKSPRWIKVSPTWASKIAV